MGILDEVEGWIEGAPAVPVIKPGLQLAPLQASAAPVSALPRGIRNNNPGNIDRDGTAWQGLAADQSSDARFCVFIDAQHGIRALVEILLTYQTVHGLKSIAAMIMRWAPPEENDTDAYINAVAGRTGIGATTVIDMRDPNICKAITAAIIAQEDANYAYPIAILEAGIALAGVV